MIFLWPQEVCSEIYILSVGVSDYPGFSNDLMLPAKDAQSVYNLYNQNNRVHSLLLINEKATVSNIINQMNQLFANADADDIVVLFFSGHGEKGGFVVYDGFLSFEKVRESMAKTSCKNKMIFADACFSGKMRQRGHSEDSSHNVLLFLSSRDNETSIEHKKMENGFFTTCLLRCLKGGADRNKDRIITAKELFIGVSEGVKILSNDKQHPVMWGHFDDDMPVMRW